MGRGETHRVMASVVALVLAGGCQAGDDGDFGFGEGSTGPGPLTTATTPGDTGSTGPADESGDSGGVETAGDSDESDESGEESSTGEPPTVTPCTTIDILVVIDNSDTMAEEQAKLTAAIEPFVTLVGAQLPGVMGSIHVGVLSTDAPELVTSTPAATCIPYATGATWMAPGETLVTELACATALGIDGDPDERPMQNAAAAITPEMNGLDGANEGFLREEGPLVIILVTDEEDDFEEETEWGSPGDPPDWVEAIVATKDGWEQDVIVMSLIGTDKPNACPEFQWNGIEGAEIAPRLREFTETFPRHAVGDVCAPEYGTFLNGFVPSIVQACMNYVLP
jgi:hypothetical protein